MAPKISGQRRFDYACLGNNPKLNFRDQVIKHSVQDRLFDESSCQLDAEGLVLKQGTLIDAAAIQAAPKKPPTNGDRAGGRSLKDPDFYLGRGQLLKKCILMQIISLYLRITRTVCIRPLA